MKSKKPLDISKIHFKEGGLHESLGVPKSKKIPAAKMAKALHSKNDKIRKEAQLAENMKRKKK